MVVRLRAEGSRRPSGRALPGGSERTAGPASPAASRPRSAAARQPLYRRDWPADRICRGRPQYLAQSSPAGPGCRMSGRHRRTAPNRQKRLPAPIPLRSSPTVNTATVAPSRVTCSVGSRRPSRAPSGEGFDDHVLDPHHHGISHRDAGIARLDDLEDRLFVVLAVGAGEHERRRRAVDVLGDHQVLEARFASLRIHRNAPTPRQHIDETLMFGIRDSPSTPSSARKKSTCAIVDTPYGISRLRRIRHPAALQRMVSRFEFGPRGATPTVIARCGKSPARTAGRG